jgi:GDP-L-fucose synthase
MAEYLAESYEIVIYNRQQLDLLDSAAVFEVIKKGGFDAVVHAATYDAAPKHSTKDPRMVLENNLRMFFNIARCEDYFGRMLYFGSGAEFDRAHWIPKMKEDYFDRYVPSDQYGFSKYIMTKYALENKKIYNLRLFAVFGCYEDYLVRFISNACCHAILDLPIRIRRNAFYDFLAMGDLAKIVAWFIENKPGETVYNICTGTVHDFKSIAEMIIKISGKNLDVRIQTEGLGSEYSGDNSLFIGELNGFIFTPFEEAIRNLYAWYSSHREVIDTAYQARGF